MADNFLDRVSERYRKQLPDQPATAPQASPAAAQPADGEGKDNNPASPVISRLRTVAKLQRQRAGYTGALAAELGGLRRHSHAGDDDLSPGTGSALQAMLDNLLENKIAAAKKIRIMATPDELIQRLVKQGVFEDQGAKDGEQSYKISKYYRGAVDETKERLMRALKQTPVTKELLYNGEQLIIKHSDLVQAIVSRPQLTDLHIKDKEITPQEIMHRLDQMGHLQKFKRAVEDSKDGQPAERAFYALKSDKVIELLQAHGVPTGGGRHREALMADVFKAVKDNRQDYSLLLQDEVKLTANDVVKGLVDKGLIGIVVRVGESQHYRVVGNESIPVEEIGDLLGKYGIVTGRRQSGGLYIDYDSFNKALGGSSAVTQATKGIPVLDRIYDSPLRDEGPGRTR